jgi:hypothetical protein
MSKPTKTIDSFFGKKPDVIEHVKPASVIETVVSKPVVVDESKELSLVEQFKKSLTPNELIAHQLAEKMLGTSYDIMRTHGYLNWLKSRKT